MPLALIVEDGTNVANANSYATLDQIAAFNAQRGITMPATSDAVVALATEAMDYLASYEFRLQGRRTFGSLQSQAWPRSGVRVYGGKLPSSTIPKDIIDMQCALAGIATTIDLYGNLDTRAITKEVIAGIETDYSATAGASAGPLLPTVFAMLRPYLNASVGMLTSRRI